MPKCQCSSLSPQLHPPSDILCIMWFSSDSGCGRLQELCQHIMVPQTPWWAVANSSETYGTKEEEVARVLRMRPATRRAWIHHLEEVTKSWERNKYLTMYAGTTNLMLSPSSDSDRCLKMKILFRVMPNANAAHSARYFKARGSPKASAHRGCINKLWHESRYSYPTHAARNLSQ